jgi:ABC-type Mn2+/Zn2+ transport system permease subunit/Mn-dependent DtxR family transcriptional regulator
VFSGFYALGVVLLMYIQNGGNLFAPLLRLLGRDAAVTGGQSGLETFLFGQIVAVSSVDVAYMAILAALSIALVALFWRMLAIASFDESYAFSVGIPVRRVHYLLTVLLTVAIVISVQSVGVVLVAAMLITPAATAYLLTDRLHRMAVLSAVFGAVAGVAGAIFSVVLTRPGRDWPTGASMVLSAALLFTLAFLLAPRYGLIPRVARRWGRRSQTQAENLLRTLYLMAERRAGDGGKSIGQVDLRFGVHDVAAKRQESVAHVRRLARLAARRRWIDRHSRDPLILTEQGLAEARRVVRNHRLWELFLAQEAGLGHEQVHADAEYIEHVLPPEVLARLERMLDHPALDPHGKMIP